MTDRIKQPEGYEVHEHCFVSGPRAKVAPVSFTHSHEGGDRPHRHPDTGSATYTIDKDEWRRQTGMVGGGRKKFTKRPTGEQLPLVTLTPEETHFEVIGFDPPNVPTGFKGTGSGTHPVIRMMMAHKLTPAFRVIPGGKGQKNG